MRIPRLVRLITLLVAAAVAAPLAGCVRSRGLPLVDQTAAPFARE